MRELIKTAVKKLLKQTFDLGKHKALVTALSVLIVIFTVYSLVLPAATLEKEAALEQGGITLEETQAEASQDAPEAGTLEYVGEGYKVEASFGKDAGFSGNTTINASEVASDSREYKKSYDKYVSLITKALKEDHKGDENVGKRILKLYDISFAAGDDGEKTEEEASEVEPEAPVSVRIKFDDRIPKDVRGDIKVVHLIENEKSGKIKVDILDDDKIKVNNDTVSFEAESFSVYAIVDVSSESAAPESGGLDKQSYGIVWNNNNVSGMAMMSRAATTSGTSVLTSKATTVRTDPVGRTDKLFVANNATINMWNFVNITSDGAATGDYYITTESSDGSLKYLRLGTAGITLVDPAQIDENCRITITKGTGARSGKVKLTSNGRALTWTGSYFSSAAGNTNNDSVWMYLAERSALNDDDFVTYTATKVSVSGKVNDDGTIDYDVKNGDQVVIYTRIWSDEEKKYEYYMIDYDGMLVKAYQSGDTISWVGSKVNTMLWDFTEYYYTGTTTPNYYYELQNNYSGKYIAPQVSGEGFLSDDTIGINLNGRRNNKYYTTILAWDDLYYDYASLKIKDGENGKQLISAPMSRADDFYFAVMKKADGQQTEGPVEVTTMDHTSYGIQIKMQDYGEGTTSGNYRSTEMDTVIGSSIYNQWTGIQGLMQKNLGENDYPTSTQTGKSLSELFSKSMEVNHQFISTTYKETGYFEYDSTQNFAHLIWQESDPWIGQERPDGGTYGIGDFVVYGQLGTTDETNKDTLKHGQFLPYNDILGKPLSTIYVNEMDIHAKPLSSLDPRKGEKMYSIHYSKNGPVPETADHFFGMEMSASFMQSQNGLDDWGHDLIFEFSGDDDFWLYIDGMLVLDLGGVHSALDGSINFRTGNVVVNGRPTNLRTLYKEAYMQANPSASTAEVNEWLNGIFKDDGSNTGTVFKDYSGHTMRMFYFERGAGASNLHMKFNLAPYTKGEAQLEKEVTGTENIDAQFPFQIWVQDKERPDDAFVLWEQQPEPQDDEPDRRVVDTKTGDPIPYEATYTTQGITYDKVFLLSPGQIASIKLPDEDTVYYIKECAIDPGLIDEVTANDEEITGTQITDSLYDYKISPSEVVNRKKVIYNNHVNPGALRSVIFTKRLWEDNEKTREIHSGDGTDADNTEFRFRIYIGKDRNGNAAIYNTGKYYIKDPDGYYCIYQNGVFVSTGKRVFSELSTEIPPGEWKSEQEKATFYTSPGGAADKIKAGYSVEIPELLIGTYFMVEERDGEVPTGYNLLGYTLTDGPYQTQAGSGAGSEDENEQNYGEVSSGYDEQTVSVHNQHGYGLKVNKVWSDAAFMDSHNDIYFGVYFKNETEPLEGSVRRLTNNETSITWFFPRLADGSDLNDYKVYELDLTGNDITVDPDTGVVSGWTSLVRKSENDSIDVYGDANEHGLSDTYTYTVNYTREELTLEEIQEGVNSRTDNVKNSRPGIRIVKTDTAVPAKPLEGAVFTLNNVGNEVKVFTSMEDGLVVVAYLLKNNEYTLTEAAAPYGYQSLINDLTIRVDADNRVFVNGSDSDPESGFYTVSQVSEWTPALMPTITIKNKDNKLKAVKIDSNTQLPIEGVKFSLYREVYQYAEDENGNPIQGNPMPDYTPMEGYEELVTDHDGVIPKLVLRNSENPKGLKPGKYYLREETPSAYKESGYDIRITISDTGQVTLERAKRPAQSGPWQISDIPASMAVITTEAEQSGEEVIVMTVKNTPKEPVRIRKKNAAAPDENLDGIAFELYKLDQINTQTGQPKDGEFPLISDSTAEGGILNLIGLEPDISYYLIETETLDGYDLLSGPVIITASQNGTIHASLNNTPLSCQKVHNEQGEDVWEITVYNSPGVELPSAGGPGTHWIYFLGGLLSLVCGILLVARKRIKE